MLVTIVTPSYNQGHYIEATIQSVLAQDYPHIEYIVIDGASTDGTVKVLQAYSDRIKWISEPDAGQVDAVNKGLRMASGEIMAYLNSDDQYLPGTVSRVVDFFQTNPAAAFVHGDAVATDAKDHTYGLRVNVAPSTFESLLRMGDSIVQPAAFWRKSLYEKVGEFDLSYNYAFDYEYWIRAAQYYDLHYIPYPLACERVHGEAKTSTGGLRRIRELRRLGDQYGGDGIPQLFRPHAAATYIHTGVLDMLQGRRQAGWRRVKLGFAINNSNLKLFIYLASMFTFGRQSVPRLRLYSNRIRYYFSKLTR